MADRWQRLNEIFALYTALLRAQALLSWDQQTYMPRGGVEARAETSAALARHTHEVFTHPEVVEILESLAEEAKELPYESDKASIVRLARREYEKEVKLPASLVEELSRTRAIAEHAWEEARERSDFAQFEPHLRRIVELQRAKAEALGYRDRPYDALLDLYEPEMPTADVEALFDRLKKDLVPLVRRVAERAGAVEDAVLRRDYDEDKQLAFTVQVIEKLGFDLSRGRQDLSAHPFTMGIAPTDVRLTTRVDRNYLPTALYGSIHEAGHGMYEQGLPLDHLKDPIGQAVSLGIHESQSRLWENVVGRSRGFWEHFFPGLKALFPEQLHDQDAESIYRAVNRVQYPSPIRVEADELHYNLHIFLRFELEQALIHGELDVKDLPEAWNAKTREYLGFTPKDDREGVLQDIHWSAGNFGYFPTYSLGTVLSVQLYNQAVADRPEIPDGIRKGEFEPLRSWMHEHIYRHGARFTPMELVQKATGRGLDPEPYLRYIKEKFSDLYGL